MSVACFIATLDTKGEEVRYMCDIIRAGGHEVLVVDVGILGEPPLNLRVDVSSRQVAEAAGTTLEELRTIGSRGLAVDKMIAGVKAIASELYRTGRVHGFLSVGGAEGTVIGTQAMQIFPVGVPKLMISTMASGSRTFGPYTGTKDVLMMHSVVDILGLNKVSRTIFDTAAAAMVGMLDQVARASLSPKTDELPRIAMTTYGNTMGAVMVCKPLLEAKGYEVVTFHANGIGGRAMEEMIDQGLFDMVLDLTTHELTDLICDGNHNPGPDRLKAAARRGLPQVLAPGCIDYIVQGAKATLPAKYQDRATYYMNPLMTLVRTAADEMAEVGRLTAKRLNESRGPVVYVLPGKGFSLPNHPGGALYDPPSDDAFRTALRQNVHPPIELIEIDAHINDAVFARALVDALLRIAKPSRAIGTGSSRVP
jgi:uncharacterized protein (UPF0261 family)